MTNLIGRSINLVIAIAAIAILSMTATAQTKPEPPVEAPSPSLVKDGRCFEIRTYYAFPGKLEDLHNRFRQNTLRIFKKHGMQVIGFWGPTDKDKGSENTLVYILAYPSREAREKAWAAFRSDPEWTSVAKESEKNGKLVEKVDSVILKGTDYSPIK